MPRFNVEHEGYWACFSTVVDEFITEFMPLEEYEKWRREEYGRNCGTVYESNRMSYEEALSHMHVNAITYDEARKNGWR